MNVAFYTACKADRKPIHSQFTHKVVCGSVEYDQETKARLREEGFLLDEDGESISAMNYTFADVANIFYVWKNAGEEFVGVNQYKRWWRDDIDRVELKENTLYVPEKLMFAIPLISHIKTNRETAPERGVATDSYLKLCKANRFRLDMSNSLLYSSEYTAHNMFFGHRETFNAMCEVLFDYLWPIYDDCHASLPKHDPYHARQMGFVSEVVIDGIIKNSGFFFGNKVSIERVAMNG